MANHKSAKKRARQSERRRLRNRQVKSRMRSSVKTFQTALSAGDPAAAEKLRAAEGSLRRAASGGVIPKRRASRTVSRLARRAARSTAGSKG